MIARLHYITQDIQGIDHHELAMQACSAGIDWVQLRVKNKSHNEWLDIALQTELVCRKYHSKLIVNDNPTIAKQIKADGVHLGKTDMSPSEARKILGSSAIIGGTANTFDDILKLYNQGVDYVGLGPFKFTTTKENLSPVLGLEGYQRIIEQCVSNGINTPIIAIGGIVTDDIKPLVGTGIYGIAVASAISKAPTVFEAAKKFKNKINSAYNSTKS